MNVLVDYFKANIKLIIKQNKGRTEEVHPDKKSNQGEIILTATF